MSFIEIGQAFGSDSEYLYMLIITISIAWALLVLFSLRKYGVKTTIRYFVPMMGAALFIEAAGVANGRFSYPGYLIYFSVLGGSVPLIILLGWSTNLFLFLNMSKLFVARIYQQNNLIRLLGISICSGLIGICLDLLEDPLAHHNQWWVWTESTGGLNFFNVPFSNYLDWFFILFFMSLATLIIDRLPHDENRKLLISFTSLPLIFIMILLAHYAFTGLFEVIGFI